MKIHSASLYYGGDKNLRGQTCANKPNLPAWLPPQWMRKYVFSFFFVIVWCEPSLTRDVIPHLSTRLPQCSPTSAHLSLIPSSALVDLSPASQAAPLFSISGSVYIYIADILPAGFCQIVLAASSVFWPPTGLPVFCMYVPTVCFVIDFAEIHRIQPGFSIWVLLTKETTKIKHFI